MIGEVDNDLYEINERVAEVNYKMNEIREILRTDYHKKKARSSVAEKQEIDIIDNRGKGG